MQYSKKKFKYSSGHVKPTVPKHSESFQFFQNGTDLKRTQVTSIHIATTQVTSIPIATTQVTAIPIATIQKYYHLA